MPTLGALTAGVVTGLLFAMFLVGGEWRVTYTWGLVLLPVLGGFFVAGLMASHASLKHWLPLWLLNGFTVLAVAGFSIGMAGIFAVGNPHPLGQASVFWMLLMAGALGALAWLFASLFRGESPS
ncbi:hypothetical protein [Kocuria sp.]|uniref:hypothetical protein n=1 Tax=Kocuria sp. TaxID=1871328 RepID=UPI0026E0731A|nr:hypothetical protein [Kocuria sp.]MDO5618078.1 hypothetical protein [Kocuria sp.]